MHYNYNFFLITHFSKTNKPMGLYLQSTSKCISFDDTTISKQWFIGESFGKKRRLPHPSLWEPVTEDEHKNGIIAVSCLS